MSNRTQIFYTNVEQFKHDVERLDDLVDDMENCRIIDFQDPEMYAFVRKLKAWADTLQDYDMMIIGYTNEPTE